VNPGALERRARVPWSMEQDMMVRGVTMAAHEQTEIG
jgi:hypothetical protein